MVLKRPYHHGNLKPALLRAAVELIAEVGPAAFTLREVARRAGISQHLLVMFDWPLAPDRYPELSAAAKRAFSVLVGLVEAAQCEGSLPGGDPLALACIAWSMVHGVAKLAIAKRLPFKSESEVLRFAAHAIKALYDGMGPKQAPSPSTISIAP